MSDIEDVLSNCSTEESPGAPEPKPLKDSQLKDTRTVTAFHRDILVTVTREPKERGEKRPASHYNMRPYKPWPTRINVWVWNAAGSKRAAKRGKVLPTRRSDRIGAWRTNYYVHADGVRGWTSRYLIDKRNP